MTIREYGEFSATIMGGQVGQVFVVLTTQINVYFDDKHSLKVNRI